LYGCMVTSVLDPHRQRRLALEAFAELSGGDFDRKLRLSPES
jgi:hypothetical protein